MATKLCRIPLLLFAALVMLANQAIKAQAIRPAQPASQPLLGKAFGSGGYTTVRGIVRLARTNRPVAGVLLALETCSYGYLGALCGDYTGDSVRTDAQGRYELRFYPQADKSYIIRFDPGLGQPFGQTSRFVFTTNARLVGPDGKPNSREIRSDSVTTADFAPDFAPNYSKSIDLHFPAAGH